VQKMEKVLIPSVSLDEGTFDNLIEQIAEGLSDEVNRFIIDLKDVNFIDPYGMVGLLKIGDYLNDLNKKPHLSLPQLEDVYRYLERMNFFQYAQRSYSFDNLSYIYEKKYSRIEDSDVLLEITRIERTEDIHSIVTKVKSRAFSILSTHLSYDSSTINEFIVSLSELCQNILEHSENTGYVGIQKYFYLKRLGKNIVKIAIMDLGIGIKKSLEERFFPLYRDKWDDTFAIEKALLHGASRYKDLGRGQGLNNVRRFVIKWKGKISIRSGTGKLAIIPPWDRGKTRNYGLSYFPGTQVGIVLPQA